LSHPIPSPEAELSRFSHRIDELRAALIASDPYILAAKSGTNYTPIDNDTGELQLFLWNRQVTITYPLFMAHDHQTGRELSQVDHAMLLYYLNHADGFPVEGRWISFSELPNGRFYNQAFQGYTGQVLARSFGNDPDQFEYAAHNMASVRQFGLGDLAYTFQALPRVTLLLVFWNGDEDFPASFQVLFDASASHYLPTDAYAILGSTLTRRLIKSVKETPNA